MAGEQGNDGGDTLREPPPAGSPEHPGPPAAGVEPEPTLVASSTVPAAREAVRSFRLVIIEGSPAATLDCASGRCGVGSHPLNDLVIQDPTVSRFHCEIRVEDGRVSVADLRSKNGTVVDGVHVRDAFLRDGSLLRLGRVVLRFELGTESKTPELSAATRFGALVGSSPAMRTAIALLERTAAADVTVLIEGETGTGKGKAAEAIHEVSSRRKGPFVVVDCAAIPENLLESELFGHEKGAFTGAETPRIGAFEEASGGTVFLDEVGELPFDLQPKLLRVLENRQIRRIGSNKYRPIDVRIVAATNRDLRTAVNEGRFRSDLYYRLAVVTIPIPPLRDRSDDIVEIAEEILRTMGLDGPARARLLAPRFVDGLRRNSWPGNVRELRNHLERALVFPDEAGPPAAAPPGEVSAPDDVVPFSEGRKHALARFERDYLEMLLRRFEGRVSEAAQAAGVDRVYLYRLLRRHGMRPGR